MSLDEPLLLQMHQVFVYGGYRVQFEVLGDLVQTRGVAVPADGVIDEAQNLLLSLRQHHEASRTTAA
jgi:hypothetical protein